MEINPLKIWRSFWQSEERRAQTAPVASGVGVGRAIAGGRVTMDDPNQIVFGNLFAFSPDESIRGVEFDAQTLRRFPPAKLLSLLADLSPEVSRALHDHLLMCNPGWTAKALKPGTGKQDKAAQEALDGFLSSLHGPYAPPNALPTDVVINSLFIQPFLSTGFFAELVLSEDGRLPLEIATPNPAHLKFLRAEDAARGVVWRLCQQQLGELVPLDRPTVAYIPFQPLPGKPYGRALASPALFTTLFLLAMLYDIKRVVQQQGWPRPDITVKFEELVKMMPDADATDPASRKAWLESAFNDIGRMYGQLKPDDAFVHPDAVEVSKQPVGTMNASGLGVVDGLIKALERMSTRALKTMPLLMATTDGVSEANANRQWEIHAAGIKALQHQCETLLENLLTIALQVQGIAAKVEFRFAELRAAELLRDAQTQTLLIANEARKRDEGWQTNDDAANAVVGHNAVADPISNLMPISGGAGLMGIKADPGSERAFRVAAEWGQYRRETAFVENGKTIFAVPFGEWKRIREESESVANV
jgi:hypothetical protein